MKKIVFRLTALLAVVMITMSAQAKTQDWGGRVIDEKGEPMPFVNVVLLSLPDSAFVQGATTDEQGMLKIITDVNDGLFKVTSVGYQTLYIKAGQDLCARHHMEVQRGPFEVSWLWCRRKAEGTHVECLQPGRETRCWRAIHK